MYFTTGKNEKYCGSHQNPDTCRFCLCILPRGTQSPCAACVSQGYKDGTQALPSIHKVTSWLETLIGPHNLLRVPVEMADGNDFQINQRGLTNWMYNGYSLDVRIEMLGPAQPHMFEPTLAHEYGHVLLVADPVSFAFTGGLGHNREQEEEGFCEVLRYLWVSEMMSSNRDLELKAIKDNPDSVYGDGFRLMWPRYKAAGSVMNLRADMLGISRSHSPKSTGWPFGKKKQPIVPPSVSAPTPDTPSTPPPLSPQVPPTPVSGGSHRPMIDLDLGNKNTPVSPADQGAAQPSQPARPVIDLTSGNVSTPPSPPPAQPNNAPARPIIDLN
jgi:hypothetical protein